MGVVGAGGAARHTTPRLAPPPETVAPATVVPPTPAQHSGEIEHLDSAERGCNLSGDKALLSNGEAGSLLGQARLPPATVAQSRAASGDGLRASQRLVGEAGCGWGG